MSDEPKVIEKVYVIEKQSWSPGVAAVLSFFIPGLGQLYKGQIFNGIAWFCVTAAGYIFIFPGLILHLFCIIGAASGAKSEKQQIEDIKKKIK